MPRAAYKSSIPTSAYVNCYVGQDKTLIDCYRINVLHEVSLEDFVGQFYRGRLFKIERWVIKTFTGHPSSDTQIDSLLSQRSANLSAWTQEFRGSTELVMCDYQKRTCSWFMTEKQAGGGTGLYFGTVLKPTDHFKRME